MPIHISDKTTAEERGVTDDKDIDDTVRESDALFDEPIIGLKPKTKEPGVVPLPLPKEMTDAQLREHMLTHLPYCDGCPYCVAARRPNTQHRQSLTPRARSIPHLVADYGFIREKDETLMPFLAVRVHPWKIFFATHCDSKGPEPRVVKRLAQMIKDCGLVHFVYKSDR